MVQVLPAAVDPLGLPPCTILPKLPKYRADPVGEWYSTDGPGICGAPKTGRMRNQRLFEML